MTVALGVIFLLICGLIIMGGLLSEPPSAPDEMIYETEKIGTTSDFVRPDGYRYGGGFSVKVAGTRHRQHLARAFYDAVKDAGLANEGDFGILLEREPGNSHDPNAIKVIGRCKGNSWHVGYVPADVAVELSMLEFFKEAELYALYKDPWRYFSNDVDTRFMDYIFAFMPLIPKN